MTPLTTISASLDQGWSPRCLVTSSNGDEDWAVIKTTAIQPLRFEPSENKQLPLHLHPRPHLQIQGGDILITRAGPRSRVGICCYVSECRPRLLLCDKAYRLRLRNDIADGRYVAWMLNSKDVLQQIEAMKSGISDSGLNLKQERFLQLAIPLPPLAEQRRIVARIEALFARTRRARADLERIAPLSLRYSKAALSDVLSGRVPEGMLDDGKEQPDADPDLVGVWPFQAIPSTWSWSSFSNLFEDWTSSRRKLQQKRYGSAGLLPVIDQGESPIGGWTDDVSLAYGGPLPALIFGDHTRIVKFTSERFVQGADGVKILAARDTALCPRLGYWLLRGLPLPDKGYSRHSKFLRGSYFPVPPLGEQPGLAAKLDGIEERASILRSSSARAFTLLDRLEQSILARAFRGELVPQDPAESADALAPTAPGEGAPVAQRRRTRAVAA